MIITFIVVYLLICVCLTAPFRIASEESRREEEELRNGK